MQKNKFLSLKSFRSRVIIGLILIIAVITLILVKYRHKNTDQPQSEIKNDTSIVNNEITNIKPDSIPKNLDYEIDSVLYNFGIKKEWITTSYSNNVIQKNTMSKTEIKKKYATDVKWFAKNVLVPKDLSSIEINLDLTNYVKNAGLSSAVNEDILTKDITFIIRSQTDTNKSSFPVARVIINHSDKAKRETGTFVLILNNIAEYKKEEIDNILSSTYEFSFIFPRSLDDIDIQSKLIQQKKDVVINLTIGRKENPEADFNTGLDEKEIRQRVKSFTTDFPSISTVILTKAESGASQPTITSMITKEFNNFKIRVIQDSALTYLLNKNEEGSKDKAAILINNMKSKGSQTSRNFMSIITLSYKDFVNFYNELAGLKKLGFKFYSLSDYLNKEAEKQKREKLKEEKLKDSNQKEQNIKDKKKKN